MNERMAATTENLVVLREMSRLCALLNTTMKHSDLGVAIFEKTELQHYLARYVGRTIEILGEENG